MSSTSRKVIKTGNSLSLTVPSNLVDSFDIKEGDVAQIKADPAHASITYVFSGHPRQLFLIGKKPK